MNKPDSGSKLNKVTLTQLIKRFAPVVHFSAGENYLPASPENYIKRSVLMHKEMRVNTPMTEFNLLTKNGFENYFFEPMQEFRMTPARLAEARVYVNAIACGKQHTDLQYWLFFAATGNITAGVKWLIDDITGHSGKVPLGAMGKINGHWKRITVRINNTTLQAEKVYLTQGRSGVWIDYAEFKKLNEQPEVFLSVGGHVFCKCTLGNEPECLKFNLFTSRLEFSICYEAGRGEQLNTAGICELVSANFLEEELPLLPWWFKFLGHWGNPEPGHLTNENIKATLVSAFGKSLDFLLSKDILDELANYLKSHFTMVAAQSCSSPMARRCWLAEEN